MGPAPAPHLLLSASAIRGLEARGLAATPPGTLMSRAADAVADACVERLRSLPARTPVLALVGPGNNGGDALLAALRLAARGFAVRAIALSARRPDAGDAARVRDAWDASGRTLGTPADLADALAARPLVIDGLFGIGLARPLDGAAAAVVADVNDSELPVIAVDVPSGLDADRGGVVGGVTGTAIRAAATVTMLADKPGLRTGAGSAHAGRVTIADLGLPALGVRPETVCGATGGPFPWGVLIDAATVGPLGAPRAADAHKGRFGDVLVVAGEASMRGAATLAALGAQAVGAGRLYVGLDDDDPAATDPLHPELMTRRLRLRVATGEPALGPATAVVAGCGLGRGERANRALAAALDHPAALVLDADGLNGVAADGALGARLAARAAAGRPTVLTPHPLEAARLLGLGTADVQQDRIGSAHRIAAATGACVVLKGAGTVIALPDGSWRVNASGGPILSVAGTGDVLAGTIAGLLAAGLAPADAASGGAWLHGAAGDALAADPAWRGAIGLPASRLPDAIRATVNRRAVRC
ncbi:MAG: hypothetical protein RJA99_798 [Pseudomonadota bacterium]|jgi:hydroxyethylthiazole kinase-like uncharacterized protein yjeF